MRVFSQFQIFMEILNGNWDSVKDHLLNQILLFLNF